ncbi:MAG: hypothetical protein DLM60_01465 [Pseudonocardiales bacterium]|nr:hypothetical protein [Actinomycetota bacterium]PZS23952.1 MAG: hypothetical protein DLM60_01465 [Pseudonocardiales bacterium]
MIPRGHTAGAAPPPLCRPVALAVIGLLRAVAAGPGRSQQELTQHLSTPPTRLVGLVDGLEQRGMLQRRRPR